MTEQRTKPWQQSSLFTVIKAMTMTWLYLHGVTRTWADRSPGEGGWWGALPIMDYTGEAPYERGTFFRLEVSRRVGVSQLSWSIQKGWENCHVGITKYFQNTSNRRTEWLVHPSVLRPFSSEKFGKSHSIGIWKGYNFLWRISEHFNENVDLWVSLFSHLRKILDLYFRHWVKGM